MLRRLMIVLLCLALIATLCVCGPGAEAIRQAEGNAADRVGPNALATRDKAAIQTAIPEGTATE